MSISADASAEIDVMSSLC